MDASFKITDSGMDRTYKVTQKVSHHRIFSKSYIKSYYRAYFLSPPVHMPGTDNDLICSWSIFSLGVAIYTYVYVHMN